MSEKTQRKRPQPQFFHSAAWAKDFPPPQGEEYAVFGRSNVGKSSFINHVLECRNLACISRIPGKTSLANFYRVDETMVWVDLPGYGYARTSNSERKRWSDLIRSYCTKRENISGVIWLIDIRHPGVGVDREAREWLEEIGLPMFAVLTKGDKVTRSEAAALSRTAIEALRLASEPVVYSVRRHQSRERFWEKFDRWRSLLRGGMA